MAYNCYITKLINVRPHGNADKLQLGDCFGNTVCVNLDYYEGQLGVYFPTDLQLSEEFCAQHDLVRRKNPKTGEYEGGYLDPAKRNIKTIKLRGEPSDGLFLPISALNYCFEDGDAAAHVKEGDGFEELNGHPLCTKYIPRRNYSTRHCEGKSSKRKRKKADVDVAPLFYEHADTEQLQYNLQAFHPGDEIEITLKLHGTSHRIGNLPVFQKFKRTVFDVLTRKPGKPIYGYGPVAGTRRTVLADYENGYYGSEAFRQPHTKMLEEKLLKGMTAYGEIVGYVDMNKPIMASADNDKLGKEFVKTYGKTTVFSYGCKPGDSEFYLYRLTWTNDDGDTFEIPPHEMRWYAEHWGVKTVPVLWRGTIPYWSKSAERHIINPWEHPEEIDMEYSEEHAGEWVQALAESLNDGKDLIGNHIREGVVVRILNKKNFVAFKSKNFSFKVLSGIAVEAVNPDEVSADILEEM